MAIADVVDLLSCPVCGDGLALTSDGRSTVCANGHTYDLARQGYLNLLGGQQPRNADTAPMVAARDAFLSAGHYAPVAKRLGALVAPGGPQTVVLDAGGGTGYYLAAVLATTPGARGISVDVSVPASRRAAQSHPRAGAVVADVWKRLPVLDRRVDVALSVFAPRNAAEFARVLHQNGRLLVVHPEPDHLTELHGPLDLLSIETGKADRIEAGLGSLFTCEERAPLHFTVHLHRPALREVIGMGPNAFHLAADRIDAGLASLEEPQSVTVSLSVSVWALRRDSALAG